MQETLISSVVKRLMSDAPLAMLLSGGLDSSLIAAIACRYVSIQFSGVFKLLEALKKHLQTQAMCKQEIAAVGDEQSCQCEICPGSNSVVAALLIDAC